MWLENILSIRQYEYSIRQYEYSCEKQKTEHTPLVNTVNSDV